MYAYQKAHRVAAEKADFWQFIWYCSDEALAVRPTQKAFTNTIRNKLTERTTFTSVEKEMEIFFVYNQMDSEEANAINDRLSEEIPLEILTIEPDSEADYQEITVRNIPKSRLTVVYFKHRAD